MSDHNQPQCNGKQNSNNVLKNLSDLVDFYKELQTFAELTKDILKQCSNINKCNTPSAGKSTQLVSNSSPCHHHNSEQQIQRPTAQTELSENYEQEESCPSNKRQKLSLQYISKPVNNYVSRTPPWPEKHKLSSQYIELEIPSYPMSKYQMPSKPNDQNVVENTDSMKDCEDNTSRCSEYSGEQQYPENEEELCVCKRCTFELDDSSNDSVFSDCCSDDKCCYNSSKENNAIENLNATANRPATPDNPIHEKSTSMNNYHVRNSCVQFINDGTPICPKTLTRSSSEQNIRSLGTSSAKRSSEPNISDPTGKQVEINFFLKSKKRRKS
ncbi:rho GTPase-activating protein gacF-like [Teleopsis dalmanni]|uniref:rho GTPase-activating protein gacF-like n=1 Tax=Teleopsis dalmanni TaxID=139649 RepID=UPI0018CD0427|nr:rho GTPase-activating protein gacF-like [Teleopsis dalmanni]